MVIYKNALYWAKMKPDAIIPTKRDEDAGYDIYPCFKEDYIEIKPHQTKLIPTGIASVFDSSKVAILKERGSTGTKGIGQRSGVIDSGFRSEWFVPITNLNDVPLYIAKMNSISIKDLFSKNCIIYPYEKAICQAIFFDLPKINSYEISYEEILKIKSERMTGKLGSSNK